MNSDDYFDAFSSPPPDLPSIRGPNSNLPAQPPPPSTPASHAARTIARTRATDELSDEELLSRMQPSVFPTKTHTQSYLNIHCLAHTVYMLKSTSPLDALDEIRELVGSVQRRERGAGEVSSSRRPRSSTICAQLTH